MSAKDVSVPDQTEEQEQPVFYAINAALKKAIEDIIGNLPAKDTYKVLVAMESLPRINLLPQTPADPPHIVPMPKGKDKPVANPADKA